MPVVTVDSPIGTESQSGIKSDGRAPTEGQTSLKRDASVLLETSPLLQATPPKLIGFPGRSAIGTASGVPITAPPLPVVSPYTGPFDIQAGALFGYSVRALAAAKLGTNIFTLRSAGGGTQSIAALTSGPHIGAANQTAAASFLGGNNGYLKSWIDQSGNGFDTLSTNPVDINYLGAPWQGEDADQPLYIANGQSTGIPAFDSSGATDTNHAGWTETQAPVSFPGGQFTVFAVIDQPPPGQFGIFSWDVYDASTPSFAFHYGPYQGWGAYISPPASKNTAMYGLGGTAQNLEQYTNDNAAAGTFCYVEMVYTGTAGDPGVMNTTPSTSTFTTSGTNPGPTSTSWPVALFVTPSQVDFQGLMCGSGCSLCEVFVYPTASLTSGIRSQIRQNIGAFYGISVAP